MTRHEIFFSILYLSTIWVNSGTSQIYFPTEKNGPSLDLSQRPLSSANPPHYPIQSSAEDEDQLTLERIVSNGLTKLTLDINQVAPRTSSQLANSDNIVFGPVTIAAILLLTLISSVGKTFDEIAYILGLSPQLSRSQDDIFYAQERIAKIFEKMETGLEIGQRVNFATAIFMQKDIAIRPVFQQAIRLYQGDVMNLDFRGNSDMALNVINTWVSGRTNGKIPSLLAEPPPPSTKAVLVSVLYFQAAWEFPFFEGGTQLRPFYVDGRKKPSDRMAWMMTNGGDFPYYKDRRLGMEIMGFPYKGKSTTMYVILPTNSNKEKLKRLEAALTASDIHRLVNSTRDTEAVVLFPKMRLEKKINIRPILEQLGLKTLFNPYEANLALLSTGSNTFNGQPNSAPFVSELKSSQASFANDNPAQKFAPNAENRNPVNRPVQQSNRNLHQQIVHNTERQRDNRPSNSGFVQQIPSVDNYNIPDNRDVLIFNRFNSASNNCTDSSVLEATNRFCNYAGQPLPLSVPSSNKLKNPVLKPLGDIRQQILQNPSRFNPGVYADQIIHKVYMDISESGTEAAAATGISLNRSGDRVTFRVDTPFLFFVYHENAKVILFWGSINSPTPYVPGQGT